MQRVLPLRSGAIRSSLQPCQTVYQLTRGLATADGSRPESDDTLSKNTADQATPKETPKEPTISTTSSNTASPNPEPPVEKEDLVKKFKLKPSAEVGIRAGKREKQRKKELEEAARRAAEEESQSGADKIHRLFEKLQLGDDDHLAGRGSRASGSSKTAGTAGAAALSKNVSESWKFLFDEDDLSEKKNSNNNETTTTTTDNAASKETLDRIPGAADLFPTLAEYRMSRSGKKPAETSAPKVDRWKDPKLKSAEKDAFKTLFSSLFEQKSSTQESTPGSKVQSLFSNFNRSGISTTKESTSEDSATAALFGTLSANTTTPTPDTTPTTGEDPMQILNRQLFNLSKRVEPIYLERKPKTSSFQAMESTVAGQDWMSRESNRPTNNSLFATIRDENKVAIRMKNELESKCGDVIKVKEFVDELIAPYVAFSSSAASSQNVVKPSSISLDGLLAQAITSASAPSKIAAPKVKGQSPASIASTKRSLHPFMGHALVEHTRRQGLPVFIRVVRTESYKALLKSRWETWHDGLGCLEILKEMQRNGALVDADTRSIIRGMQNDLRGFSVPVQLTGEGQVQQHGWGDEEQAAPLAEMLNIVQGEIGGQGEEYNMKHWGKRSESNYSALHR
ncbi:hypothetical protein BGX23_002222 [Mortierella sp. AD031]|nr:hypothetical protein BGX23_002222 [Mortierella sp. AD031]KAG0208797.1 hypothetical protein BGX33_006037 [Mortierella sp. NVP41]